VDECAPRPYLVPMAPRLFLTLLALMASLAAQFTPAQARGGSPADMEMRAVPSAMVSLGQAEARAPVRERHEAVQGRTSIATDAGNRPAIQPIPTVLPGIDRARE
jgi:hypothetical protein